MSYIIPADCVKEDYRCRGCRYFNIVSPTEIIVVMVTVLFLLVLSS